MSRLHVRVGSALLALILAFAVPHQARAQATPDLWFAGTRLILERPQMHDDDIGVAVTDAGLVGFLARLGATISYAPHQRYVIVTAADRRTITLTVGDPRIIAGGITTNAPFAPYESGSDVYVSLFAIARALYVNPVADGGTTVLQPQFGALDVRSDGRTTTVTLHGATALGYRQAVAGGNRLALAFSGIASSLDPRRALGSPGLDAIDFVADGSARAPTTVVVFSLPAGAGRVLLPSKSPNELTLAFAPQGVVLRGYAVPQAGTATATLGQPAAAATAQVPEAVQPAAPAPQAATVTAVDASASDDGAIVHVAVTGGVDYEWHRLNDDRWYVDLRGATLAISPRDDQPNVGGITGLRVHQFATDPVPIVRVSLSLTSPLRVAANPSATGLDLVVGGATDPAPLKVGAGRIGDGSAVAYAAPAASSSSSAWKYGPAPPASANPHLIVLDPGHGGSDVGAAHNGLTEKIITLDVSDRLRSILISRGWQVRMTRDTDRDVYAPNDSAHDELQARCDIANNAGARMFVSIHVNSFTSSDLSGTTTYYYKGIDRGLAAAVQRRLIAALGTKDDGVRKENFYVIHHSTMPAILIETAFLSNQGDAELLRSPEFLQRIAAAIADGINDYASGNQAAAADDAARE
jgi:N-acetylmuramoyl-L-alanine amidase CwlD